MSISKKQHILSLQAGGTSEEAATPPPRSLDIRKIKYRGYKPEGNRHYRFPNGFPEELWVQGDYRLSDSKSIGIVGSRSCSDWGAQLASKLSSALSQSGFCIVSGLALGIDTHAHRGALEAGGRTLAVLPTGLNHIRPAQNKALYREIIKSGAGLSLFDPAFRGSSSRQNYYQRNVIVAGLSRVLIVVEASAISGSLSAARSALRLGRPVGLPKTLLESQAWAQDFIQKPGVFVINSIADILEKAEA